MSGAAGHRAGTNSSATILILGGTSEARELAEHLVENPRFSQCAVVSSLAGRVSHPRLPQGEVRIGGFGGVPGLGKWVEDHHVVTLIDCTHPFAEHISATAHEVSRQRHLPLLSVHRPAWQEEPGDQWIHVPTMDAAANRLHGFQRAFLTIGRQQLAAFSAVDPHCLIRCVEPPAPPLPHSHEIILDRGPFTVEGERALLERARCDVLVTKNSGGAATYGKIQAAREQGLPVIMVDRPVPQRPSPYHLDVETTAAAIEQLQEIICPPQES